MSIDWNILNPIMVGFVIFLLSWWFKNKFENKVELSYYQSGISNNTMKLQDGNTASIYTHSVALYNGGKLPATNVKVMHQVLPDFDVLYNKPYRIVEHDNGVSDIVFDKLMPGETINISYVYFTPYILSDIHLVDGFRSDEVMGVHQPVQMIKQYAKWMQWFAVVMVIIGSLTLIYSLIKIFKQLMQ